MLRCNLQAYLQGSSVLLCYTKGGMGKCSCPYKYMEGPQDVERSKGSPSGMFIYELYNTTTSDSWVLEYRGVVPLKYFKRFQYEAREPMAKDIGNVISQSYKSVKDWVWGNVLLKDFGEVAIFLISNDLCSKTNEELDRMSRVPYASAVGSIIYAITRLRWNSDCGYLELEQRQHDNSGCEGGWFLDRKEPSGFIEKSLDSKNEGLDLNCLRTRSAFTRRGRRKTASIGGFQKNLSDRVSKLRSVPRYRKDSSRDNTESHKSTYAELFVVGSGKISIHHCE
ncbi:hypothetical protein Tco_0864703 [Tanacetum coccineum]